MVKKQTNLKVKNKKEEKEKITVELPKSWVEHLEYLEKTTKKNKDYYIKKCLGRYLENAHEYEIAVKSLKSNGKTYTSKEADERLKELRVKNV